MHCDKRFFWRFVEEYKLDSQPTNQTHSSIGSSCMLLRCKHKWQLTKSWVLLLGLASALIPYQLYSLLNRKMIYWFPGSLKTHDPTSPRLKADQWKELLHLLKSALDSGKRTISKSVFALLCLGQNFWHPGIYPNPISSCGRASILTRCLCIVTESGWSRWKPERIHSFSRKSWPDVEFLGKWSGRRPQGKVNMTKNGQTYLTNQLKILQAMVHRFQHLELL